MLGQNCAVGCGNSSAPSGGPSRTIAASVRSAAGTAASHAATAGESAADPARGDGREGRSSAIPDDSAMHMCPPWRSCAGSPRDDYTDSAPEKRLMEGGDEAAAAA